MQINNQSPEIQDICKEFKDDVAKTFKDTDINCLVTITSSMKCCKKQNIIYKLNDAICKNCGTQFKRYNDKDGFVLKKKQTKNIFINN